MLDPAGFLRKERLEELTNISYSTIRRLMLRGEFPLPVQISSRAVGWRVSDVRSWLEARPSAAAPTSSVPSIPSQVRGSDEPARSLAERHQVEQRRDSIANGAFGKSYASCDAGERREIDSHLTSHERDVIVIEEAGRKARAAFAPGIGASIGSGGVAPADDQERRVVALVNAREATGRKLLAQRLAAERAIPLERAAAYLAKGPMDPTADEQAKRIAGAHKGAGLDPIDSFLDQVIVAERALAAERVRAIVESPEGLARPTLAHYMAHETALEPSASIAILRKAPVEPSADEVARRIAGAAPATDPRA